jgi:hypothetical protein
VEDYPAGEAQPAGLDQDRHAEADRAKEVRLGMGLVFCSTVLLACSGAGQSDAMIRDLQAQVETLSEDVSALDAKLNRVCALLRRATDDRPTYYPPGTECGP